MVPSLERMIEDLAEKGWEFESLVNQDLQFKLTLMQYDENGMGDVATYTTVGYCFAEPFINAYSHLVGPL